MSLNSEKDETQFQSSEIRVGDSNSINSHLYSNSQSIIQASFNQDQVNEEENSQDNVYKSNSKEYQVTSGSQQQHENNNIFNYLNIIDAQDKQKRESEQEIKEFFQVLIEQSKPNKFTKDPFD